MNIETEIQNIADAVQSCLDMEHEHRRSAHRILSVVMMLTVTLISLLAIVFLFPYIAPTAGIDATIPDAALYVFLAIYTLTFSILMALYRLHLNETARLQHHMIGFMRVRVAGSNTSAGYQGEVRAALTRDAFEFSALTRRKGKIESPVPGHPTFELTTAVLNKVLDGIDIVVKKDPSANARP